MKKLLKNQKGLTLVELLAVIVILGVIAAIAVPSIGGIIANSKTSADTQSVALIKEAAERYAYDKNLATSVTSVTIADLVSNGYLKSAPVEQATGKAYTTVAVAWANATGWTAGSVAVAAQ
ncbi:competence type IV pilus major pilin ComGC [Paenibacillus sp.]|uniref:competence type IV pilus major pilin ComGC n=1 Tax=Paenibacillus sp. TaxID=58172 RepID=UPI002D70D7E6|nr:prepilin-type N-terminal cleavage/methylation domain-containing protein [Paenibacillus sp.]HZG88492.1 prepilin-type N-terminal cleavage/methylation domain-containing protein [Paenibacillus sp.]